MFSTLRTKTRIKKVSDKRKATFPAREACVRAVMRRDKWKCRAKLEGCEGDARDVHEVKPRGRGGKETDPDGCIAVCRVCHRRIHDNPKLAAGLGLTDTYKHKGE